MDKWMERRIDRMMEGRKAEMINGWKKRKMMAGLIDEGKCVIHRASIRQK